MDFPSLPTSSQTNMKHNKYIIGGVALVALYIIVSLFFMFRGSASAEVEYPEKVKTLAQWIDEKSTEWSAADKRVADLTAQLQQAETERSKAESTARGHRFSLCNEFSLVYNAGKLTEATPEDCILFQ